LVIGWQVAKLGQNAAKLIERYRGLLYQNLGGKTHVNTQTLLIFVFISR
jgi:hypothetical protein